MITDLVAQYHAITQRIKELEGQRSELKAQIDLKLSAMGESKYADSKFSAVMSEHQRVKYNEEGLMYALEQKGIAPHRFTKSQVDLKKLEALVATGEVSATEVSNYATVTPIKTLRVNKKD